MVRLTYEGGHGVNTSGKRTPDGIREWTLNNKVVVAFEKELDKYEGLTKKRLDDVTGKNDVSLKARTDASNAFKADYHISFHHNANTGKWGNWTGVETHIYTVPGAKSEALAKALHPALVKAYGLKDRGIKKTNLHIVRETKCPAILVEGGFMDSNIDIKKLKDDKVLEAAGIGIAQAFAKHVGLKLKPVPKPVVKEEPKLVATYITVKSGDTLYKLSTSNKVTVAAIQKLNNMGTSTLIKPGQKLRIK